MLIMAADFDARLTVFIVDGGLLQGPEWGMKAAVYGTSFPIERSRGVISEAILRLWTTGLSFIGMLEGTC